MYLYLFNSIYLNTYVNNNGSKFSRSEMKNCIRSYKVSVLCILNNDDHTKNDRLPF